MSDLKHSAEKQTGSINSTELHVYLSCAVAVLIILLIDFVTPLGVAIGVAYIIVVLISLGSSKKRFTLYIAFFCSVLVGIGYLGSPPSEAPTYLIIANRLLSLFAIWVTAILALKQRARTVELHQERLKYLQSIKEVEVHEEKLKVLKATMRTVQDITGNFLNSLQFFKLEVEKNKTLASESVARLDELIGDTAQRLNKLGNLNEIHEKKMAGDTVGIDYEHSTVNDDTMIK
ncbi:MAG: hypothetical protein HRU78_08660 [Gammaproteobacteria bacterium]|nr:MAG: hypothetical protein HRU78_08660 [Gammaproteobacteria bacterium]